MMSSLPVTLRMKDDLPAPVIPITAIASGFDISVTRDHGVLLNSFLFSDFGKIGFLTLEELRRDGFRFGATSICISSSPFAARELPHFCECLRQATLIDGL